MHRLANGRLTRMRMHSADDNQQTLAHTAATLHRP